MPAGGYEFVFIFSLTYICARFPNARTWCIQLSCAISLLGGILVLALPYSNKAGLLAGYYIVGSLYISKDKYLTPVIWLMISRSTPTPVPTSFSSQWQQPILLDTQKRLSSMRLHWQDSRSGSKRTCNPSRGSLY